MKQRLCSSKSRGKKQVVGFHQLRHYLPQISLGGGALLLLALWLMLSANQSWAQDNGNSIFLPLVSNQGDTTAEVGPGAPTTGTDSFVIAEAITDETSNAPALDNSGVGAATYCQTYIRFSNYSSQKVYIYWKNNYGSETLYQTLPGGYYYWQPTYYGNRWLVRDSAGQEIKDFTVYTCNYVYVKIYNEDFPQPTPTAVVCDARIDRIRLIDTSSGLPISGLDPIQNGATINLANLPTTFTLEAVAVGSTESVKFNTNGDSLVENIVPYTYPATGADWHPTAGAYTVQAEAYSQDGASGQLCDTKQVSFTIVNSAPTATATPVPPTATPAPTNTPATCSGNLTNNGGFENGFTGWSVAGYSDTQLTISSDANGGSQAALLRGIGGVYISQPINVIGGATYELTAYGKTNNPAIYSAFGLNFYDGNGVRVGQAQAPVTSGSYSAVSTSFMAPINTAYIDLYLYTDGGFDFFGDDICVTRSGGPTPTFTPGADSVKIGDRVWLDSNRDGVQDEGGTGFEGVEVELFEGCVDFEHSLGTRTTSNSGQYIFNNLAAGQYRLRFTAPAGYTFSAPNQSGEPSDSDVDNNGVTDCLTLAAGEENYDIDAGIFNPDLPIPTPTPTATPLGGYIGDRVWNDLNRDGLQGGGEPSVQGVTVELYQGCVIGGTPYQTKTTSNSGQYLFNDLLPGQYRVRVIAPDGFVFSPQNAVADDNGDSDVDSNGATACITLDAFEQDPSIDAGIYDPAGTIPTPTATATPVGGYIGDRIWNDLNQDGIQSAGEPGLPGVTVELYQGCTVGGAPYLTDLTSNSGQYLFNELAAGSYLVKVIVPAGYAVSPANMGTDDYSDSDIDTSGLSSCITLDAFEEDPSIDGGLYDPTQPTPTNTPIGPTATPTNTPAATATNTPVVPTATSTYTPVPPTATPTNTPVPPTATPTNTPIPACDARIDRIRLVDFETGIPVSGLDGIPNGATINLATLPARFYLEAVAVGSTESVKFTVNGNVQIENFTPYNYPNSDTDWNPSAGSYTISATAFNADNAGGQNCDTKTITITLTGTRKASVGGRVWNDGNYNGVQENGEAGIGGISVNLWKDTNNDGHHDTRVALTTTDSNGNYTFTGLEPGVVYVVKVSLPWWGHFTYPNVGDDSLDSDVVVFSYGGTANLVFAPGENNRTTDAGIY